MSENTVGFAYGVLSAPLEEQANGQGYTLGKKAEGLEKSRQAVIRLMFSELLTDSQTDQIFKKLQKQVVKALKPMG